MSDRTHTSNTSDTNKVSTGQKLAWGVGGVADTFMANTLNQLVMPIYNIGLGVDARLVGLALGLPRILDAFTDPFMGNVSDNTRTRWGRRRPYIFCGAILSAILYAMIWMPPASLGETGLFVYLLVVSTVFFVAYTIFSIPFGALVFEMTPDTHERTRIISCRTFFLGAALIAIPWLYWLSLVGGNEVIGVRYVGFLVAVLIIIFGIPPAIFCRENPRALKQLKIRFTEAVRLTLANRPFVWITGVLLFVLIGFNLIAPLSLYLNIYYVFEGDKELASELQGWGLSLWAVLGMASLPLITHAAKRWGKKITLFAGQALMIATSLVSWLTYSPEYPYLQLISVGLAGPALFCILIMTASMLTDVCDLDELRSRLRREGMYMAMNAFIVKAGFGAANMLSGYLLEFAGYSPDVVPSELTITSLRLLYAVVPAAFCALTFAMNWAYPLSERKLKQIRRVLDARIRRAALADRGAAADAL